MVLQSRRYGAFGLLGALCLQACVAGGCSTESRLRVQGKTPFVRCLAAAAPGDRSIRAGRLTLTVKDRTLTVGGFSEPLQIAAFSGAGFGRPPTAQLLSGLAASPAALLLMLGGLGETEQDARATLVALASLGRPVLFLAGGRDRWPVLEAVSDDGALGSPRIMDVTSLHELRIGKHTFVTVGGAEAGRYAVDEDACGYAASDLAARAKTRGSARNGGPRWLLSWHAPAAPVGDVGITRTSTGVDTGAFSLSRFAAQVGVNGGVYGWPITHAGRSVRSVTRPLQLVVPRLWGPRPERDDGSLSPLGFALLTLRDTTLEPSR